ncbi:MAG: cupredoxin domain-containing protein [Ktedonobacteraceae bacterium]
MKGSVQEARQEMGQGKRSWRHSLSTLEKVTAIALLINALCYFVYVLIVYISAGALVVPLVIIATVMLVSSLIAFIGLRWTSALGALIALAITTSSFAQPYFPYDIEHPESIGSFIPVVILTACAIVAIVAGVAATLQNYRSTERRTPRGLGTVLTGVTGIVLGTILVSLIVAANPQSSSVNTDPNAESTVHMSVTSFVQNVVLVPKGSKLLLVDDGQYQHVLQNGMWAANGTAKSVNEPGAPTLNNKTISSGSLEIGPFSTVGVYHIYCTIHEKMNLTILVQ